MLEMIIVLPRVETIILEYLISLNNQMVLKIIYTHPIN